MFNSLQLDFTHSNVDAEYRSGGNVILSYGDNNIEALMCVDSDTALQLVDKILYLLDEKTTEELLAEIDRLESANSELQEYVDVLTERIEAMRKRDCYLPF